MFNFIQFIKKTVRYYISIEWGNWIELSASFENKYDSWKLFLFSPFNIIRKYNGLPVNKQYFSFLWWMKSEFKILDAIGDRPSRPLQSIKIIHKPALKSKYTQHRPPPIVNWNCNWKYFHLSLIVLSCFNLQICYTLFWKP